jgi:hypothetical protein
MSDGGSEEATQEIDALIGELKRFDNPAGYEMTYERVKKKLEPVIQKLIQHGGAALDRLHSLLLHEETWSCLFALETLGEIRSPKSIPFLAEFIRKNEEGDYWDGCEEAMRALTAIGEPAVEPLLREVKADFEKRRFLIYLVSALTEIRDEMVYSFMVETIENYLANPEKYRGWFNLELFVGDFAVQGKKDSLPLLKRLLALNLSRHERIEVVDAIKRIEDPEAYERETGEWVEKFKQSLPSTTRQKVGRNDPCPCGSGKKYKHCCWLKTIEEMSVENRGKSSKNKTIVFKVTYLGSFGTDWREEVSRVIELKETQTLVDLHDVIQESMGWDDPHLYLFFMDGKKWSDDRNQVYRCPDPYLGVDFIHINSMRKETWKIASREGRILLDEELKGRGMEEILNQVFFMGDYFGGMEGFKLLKSANVPLGSLIKPEQEFLYLFDLGDQHHFKIKVVGFGEAREGEKYPKLLESAGKSPPQYPAED